jgi:LmbE family N-acetylglucosaminyl deacetylase
MIPASLLDGVGNVLCLGAHPDDIEIGCGGTLLKVLELNGAVDVRFVVFSGDEKRACEALRSADALLAGAKDKEVTIRRHRERYFPYDAEIKEYFDLLADGPTPDVVFTHYGRDLHQDHRTISELTWNTFRDHLILEYEIPKYDGGLDTPNVYVPLDRATCDRKVAIVTETFETQRSKPWFSKDTFEAMLRLRGVESRSPWGFAEGFHARKVVLA